MSTSLPPHDPAREGDHPLARAFRSFTEAAGSLERTYGQLHGQVAHLRQELEVTNRNLTVSLEENHRIRERLRRILEGLPCGVLVIEADARISAVNPEAARLLGGSFEAVDALPAALAAALESARQTGEERELELSSASAGERREAVGGTAAGVWVAIRHAWLERKADGASSVFILRDVSAAKQLERDSENLRRQRALVEMSALLAHEIRNPLGSLELFAGLLAESSLEGESRRWIEHVQAGLRTLSSTVNNVLDLHNDPSPESARIDAGDSGHQWISGRADSCRPPSSRAGTAQSCTQCVPLHARWRMALHTRRQPRTCGHRNRSARYRPGNPRRGPAPHLRGWIQHASRQFRTWTGRLPPHS
jgi:two-component system sensor histidine kinase FlrB